MLMPIALRKLAVDNPRYATYRALVPQTWSGNRPRAVAVMWLWAWAETGHRPSTRSG